MLKTLGLVQVQREGDFERSKISRKLGGKSLLELIVRHVTDCQRLDGVVVLLDAHEDRAPVRQLVPPDVETVSPAGRDTLANLAAVVEKYRAQAIVRIGTNNPFVDPVLIDRLVSTADAHPSCDYISYCRADGRPAILTQLGVAEWCAGEALAQADRDAGRSSGRDCNTAILYAHPERFKVRLIPLPVELDRDDVRLRIDFEEDWDHAQAICEALGYEELEWQRIADLLGHQPALRERMAALNRV